MRVTPPTVAVFGASGLIGEAVARRLEREGFRTIPIARRFSSSQQQRFAREALTDDFVSLNAPELLRLLTRIGADVIVNCVGVLQDVSAALVADTHTGFASRLVEAISCVGAPALLIHVSTPGQAEDDHTAFSSTKRAAETVITESGLPYVILRPGFVIASVAYGGSALMRALAVWPFDFPDRLRQAPFAVASILDIERRSFRSWGGGAPANIAGPWAGTSCRATQPASAMSSTDSGLASAAHDPAFV